MCTISYQVCLFVFYKKKKIISLVFYSLKFVCLFGEKKTEKEKEKALIHRQGLNNLSRENLRQAYHLGPICKKDGLLYCYIY